MAQFSSAPFSVEIALSRKFWSAENFGPRTEIFGKFGPGGLKISVPRRKSWSALRAIAGSLDH